MAPRKNTTTSDQTTTQGSAASATDTVEQRLVAFAEQLGRIVGTVQAKADGWLDRKTLTEELTRIRDGAADLLNHVGSRTASAVASTPAQRQTTYDSPGRSATATTGWRATAATGRSGGKVDAPGKTHRQPPSGGRGTKHSDEMIPKLKAAQATRRRRHG